jgi:hypothetical protein
MEAVANFLFVSGTTKQKANPRQFVYDKLMREVDPSMVK